MIDDEYAATIREMIRHEDSLINDRMNWMWALQGLLIAATSIMWGKGDPLVLIICVFGSISCVSVGLSLKSALRAIDSLNGDWSQRALEIAKRTGKQYEGPRVMGSPGEPNRLRTVHPWNILPWLMAVTWVLIAIVKFVVDVPSVAESN